MNNMNNMNNEIDIYDLRLQRSHINEIKQIKKDFFVDGCYPDTYNIFLKNLHKFYFKSVDDMNKFIKSIYIEYDREEYDIFEHEEDYDIVYNNDYDIMNYNSDDLPVIRVSNIDDPYFFHVQAFKFNIFDENDEVYIWPSSKNFRDLIEMLLDRVDNIIYDRLIRIYLESMCQLLDKEEKNCNRFMKARLNEPIFAFIEDYNDYNPKLEHYLNKIFAILAVSLNKFKLYQDVLYSFADEHYKRQNNKKNICKVIKNKTNIYDDIFLNNITMYL
jgi:hypothetical protein